MTKKKKNKNKQINKKNLIIKVIIGVLLIIIVILSYIEIKNNKVTKDEKHFKVEYEYFNDRENLSKVKYLKVNIPDKNKIRYLSSKKIVEFMKKNTGIVFFCYKEGGYCRKSAEILIAATINSNIDYINYYDLYGDRDEKILNENDEIVTFKDSTKEYKEILKMLGDKAEKYYGFDDDSLKRIYFPTVLFIKNGKIVDMHSGTVKNDIKEQKKLSKKQQQQLLKIYKNGIKKIDD